MFGDIFSWLPDSVTSTAGDIWDGVKTVGSAVSSVAKPISNLIQAGDQLIGPGGSSSGASSPTPTIRDLSKVPRAGQIKEDSLNPQANGANQSVNPDSFEVAWGNKMQRFAKGLQS